MHEILKFDAGGNVVKTVHGVELGVLLVLENGRRKVVVGAEVSDRAVCLRNDIRVHHSRSWKNPVGKLLCREIDVPEQQQLQKSVTRPRRNN